MSSDVDMPPPQSDEPEVDLAPMSVVTMALFGLNVLAALSTVAGGEVISSNYQRSHIPDRARGHTPRPGPSRSLPRARSCCASPH